MMKHPDYIEVGRVGGHELTERQGAFALSHALKVVERADIVADEEGGAFWRAVIDALKSRI